MLSVSFFSVFREYMSMLLFICLPIILLSTALAIWLHYRQKKRKQIAAVSGDGNQDFTLSMSDNAAELVAISPIANEDKFKLIKECRKQLTRSRAKFVALKHDFNTGQNTSSVTESTHLLTENYNNHMENLSEKVAAYEKQIADLQSKLEVLETVFPAHDETHYLREALRERDNEIAQLKSSIYQREHSNEHEVVEQVNEMNNTIAINTAGENHSEEQINRLQSENNELRNNIKEQGYLKDAYAESKLQVTFLQNQLEQRIRSNSNAEHRIMELTAELQASHNKIHDVDGKLFEANQQLVSKYHELEKLQHVIDEKEAELRRIGETLESRNAQVNHLESLLAEMKEQHNLLNASFADNRDLVNQLKEQLAGQEEHAHLMEDRLVQKNKLLERIFRDLESSVAGTDMERSSEGLVKQMF